MQKILVLDDDADTLATVEMLLAREGFEVKGILKWEKLPGALITFDPDLILLDVALPGADGRDICEYLNNLKESKHIPVILFSGKYNLEDNLFGCNPDAIITKPFDPNHLIETIKSLITG